MYKVVLADDEQLIRRGLMNLDWEANDMEIVVVAKNGIEVQEVIDSQTFDLLITDIKMPGMNGLELARNLAETNHSAKTILLSGYGEFDYAQKAIAIGVYDYILKPSTPEEIIDCAKKACEAIAAERSHHNEVEEMKDKLDSYEELVGTKQIIDGPDDNTDIREILKYIYVNYDQPLTLSVLAADFHFSSVYLSYYIKKYTEHTFLEILTAVRMFHAAKLLKETKLKNAEIGNRIGIQDERYFGQVFKKTYGMTPYEYRKSGFELKISLDAVLKREDMEC